MKKEEIELLKESVDLTISTYGKSLMSQSTEKDRDMLRKKVADLLTVYQKLTKLKPKD